MYYLAIDMPFPKLELPAQFRRHPERSEGSGEQRKVARAPPPAAFDVDVDFDLVLSRFSTLQYCHSDRSDESALPDLTTEEKWEEITVRRYGFDTDKDIPLRLACPHGFTRQVKN